MVSPDTSDPKAAGRPSAERELHDRAERDRDERNRDERDRDDPDEQAAVPVPNFWAVFESAPDAYLLLAPDPPLFTMVAANEARLRATMTRREEVVGRPLFEVFPDNPGDPGATGVRNLRTSLNEVLRTGKPHRMAPQKYDIRTPAGEFEERYWDPLNSPVFDDRGNLIHIIHRVEDVTEQVLSGRRLKTLESARAEAEKSRREVESILESITDAFYAVDREWRFTYVNRQAEEVLQRNREELIGSNVWEEFPEAIGTAFDREFHRAMTQQMTVEFEAFYPPLGVWVEVRAYPSPEVLSVYLRDITDRMRAEHARRESEERYRLLADMIPQHIWTTDPNGYHSYFSRRWYDFTGATPEDTEGEGWLRFLHPDDVDRTIERWQESLRTGKPYSIEYRFRRADGEYCWFLGQAMPLRNEAGNIVEWFGTLTDISERKRLDQEREQLLAREREAREDVTTILESITDAFFAVDAEWRFTHVNREAERLLKRPRRQLLGRSLWEEFSGAVDSVFEQEYHRAVTEKTTVKFEAFAPTIAIWVDVRAYPTPGGLSVFFRDITERKRAEEKLRDSEERFRALAENSTAGIFVIDDRSTIEFVNPAVEQIFGYTLSEMHGKSLAMLMPEDQRSRHDAGLRRYVETGRRNLQWEGVELPGLTKDGRVIPLEISFGEFVRDGRHYFTGIARDITERKQAEKAMRESEERFRTLGNSIPQLAWMADPGGWIFWYNDRWYEYTGTTLEEMQGWGWRKVHHPEHVDRVVERIRHAFETGTPWGDTFPLRSGAGEYRWFLSRALPIRDSSGKVVRWFGTNTDVTEERVAAAERERLLEREREARAEAEQRREELERVTESRTRLMRGFTHDVKNPLGAAAGHAQLLEDGVLGELTEKQVDSVRRICRSINASLHLIHELLELARAEAGQLELELVPANIVALVRDAAEDFLAQAAAAGLELDVHLTEENLPTTTDRARVRQILSNLLSNAVKYTPEGRITVEADIRADDSGGPNGDRIAIRVTDTGPGIPLDKREAIFQEFTRLDPTAQQGAGVGLAISRRIARLLGGDITVDSEAGRGSTFTLWLPLTPSTQGPAVA